jgi:hypothetical protein
VVIVRLLPALSTIQPDKPENANAEQEHCEGSGTGALFFFMSPPSSCIDAMRH